MSKKSSMKVLSAAVGTAFLASMAASNVANADTGANPFSMNELSGGYSQLAEGKCGGMKSSSEGKCGEGMKKGAMEEGKCGEGMKKGAMEEGKCGEGKCGGNMKKSSKEGKCGEGKCGANK